MAKRAVCDHCGKAEALALFGTTPAGWVDVQEHAKGPNPEPRQFCGWACVRDWAGNAAAVAGAESNGVH